MSLVRSNPEGEVGFLGEKRRLNGESMIPSPAPFFAVCFRRKHRSRMVSKLMRGFLVAMTRPKRSLTIIGDSETVQR